MGTGMSREGFPEEVTPEGPLTQVGISQVRMSGMRAPGKGEMKGAELWGSPVCQGL